MAVWARDAGVDEGWSRASSQLSVAAGVSAAPCPALQMGKKSWPKIRHFRGEKVSGDSGMQNESFSLHHRLADQPRRPARPASACFYGSWWLMEQDPRIVVARYMFKQQLRLQLLLIWSKGGGCWEL